MAQQDIGDIVGDGAIVPALQVNSSDTTIDWEASFHPSELEKSPDQATLAASDVPAKAPTSQKSRLTGWANFFDGGLVRGWIADTTNPDQIFSVEIYVGDELIGATPADIFRPDTKIGNCLHGFDFILPSRFLDGQTHVLTCKAPNGSTLNTRTPTFSGTVETHPELVVESVGPDGLTCLLRNLNTFTDTGVVLRASGQEPVFLDKLEWGAPTAAGRRFHAPIEDWTRSNLDLRGDVRLSFRIDPIEAISASLWDAAQFNWSFRDGVLQAEVGTNFPVPDGLVANLSVSTAERGSNISLHKCVFQGNIITATLPLHYEEIGFAAGLQIDEVMSGKAEQRFTFRGKPQSHILNADFDRWDEQQPAHWETNPLVQVDRGARSLLRDLPASKSQNTLLITTQKARNDVLIARQSLSPLVGGRQFTTGVIVRGTAGARLQVRVKGQDDRIIQSSVITLTQDWIAGCFDHVRNEAEEPIPAAFEIWLEGAAGEGEPCWVEIDAADVVSNGAVLFWTQPDGVARVGPSVNLVANANLNHWSAPGIANPTTGRFEVAEGWYLHNHKSLSPVIAVPVPLMMFDPAAAPNHYALSITAPEVSRFCRLGVPLRLQDVAQGEPLRVEFSAAARSIAEAAAGPRVRPGKWTFIDRVFLLATNDAHPPVERIVMELARKVLVTRERERYVFATEVSEKLAAAVQAGDENYYIVFEFHSPFLLTIDSVDLRIGGQGRSAPSPILQLEDRNIAAQIGSVKGCEHWLSPSPVRIAAGTEHRATAGALRKWDWGLAELGSIEIVVCVYNAIEETLACLASLAGSTSIPHTVLLVDDGSGPETTTRLSEFAEGRPWVRISTNKENMGYTRSADFGIRNSRADWVVLLNSDTIVTDGWLEGLMEAALSAPDVAMVGPVSNAATYQSIPQLYDRRGKWAVNEVPDDWSIEEVAALVKRVSLREFPEAPLLNGFCTLMRRSVFLEVGGLDSNAFPVGYGEENDLCLRVSSAGYKLLIADHVYVYHSKSASFGSERRLELSKIGTASLKAKHPDANFELIGRTFMSLPALTHLRAAVAKSLSPLDDIQDEPA